MPDQIKLKSQIKKFLDSDSIHAQATKILLATVFLSGAVIVAAVAPNLFSAFGRYKKIKGMRKEKFDQSLSALKRRGFVEIISEINGQTKIRITAKGESIIKTFCIDTMKIAKPQKWDRKWRIVMFDIPTKFEKERGAFRETLKDLGFKQIQKSAWIYPYPCENEALFIAKMFNVDNFIEILTVENFLKQDEVTRKFNLR